ncbi:unnamed protein product [Echinostoma caproni]|uniref:Peptidase A1 domain-containing protein n=1 Tax=Echinostoma caproni TaxID=27848 RepID=A0A183B5H3_9TREM|nr:unnamed protein product [Echinostoma caproni]
MSTCIIYLESYYVLWTITASRGLPSTGTRYVAARYMQDYFDPPPRHARNFTLGALPTVKRAKRFASAQPENSVSAETTTNLLLVDVFTAGMDLEINFDNKLLVVGQEYKAFIRACVFQDDQSTGTGPNACTSSDWSLGFGPDRPVLPWNALGQSELDEYGPHSLHGASDDGPGRSRSSGPFGFQVGGNDLFVIAVVAVIVGLTLVAVICIAFGCFMRRIMSRRVELMKTAVVVGRGGGSEKDRVSDFQT